VAVVLSSLASSATAQINAVVSVDSPTELSISLTGILFGIAPSNFDSEVGIDLGTSNYTVGGTDPSSTSGSFGGVEPIGALFNNGNTLNDSILVIFSPPILTAGQEISGTVTFTYDSAHQIAVGESFDVYWGASATGTLQSSGITVSEPTSVPEPSSLSILGIAGVAVIFRRRRREHV